MSFVYKAAKPLRSEEDIARTVYQVALARKLDKLAAVLALMCIRQESAFWCPWNAKDPSSQKYPNDSQSDDGRSVGYYQQQNGRAGEVLPAGDRDNWWGDMASRMSLEKSTDVFLSRLSDDYTSATTAVVAGQFIQAVQGSAFPDAYSKHWTYCWDLLGRAIGGTSTDTTQTEDDMRPDFNEFAIWSSNYSSRGGTKVDAFVLHTSEGFVGNDAAAEQLSKWYQNANEVSYHYAVSQASDGGVTVVDNVDTDYASWSVLSANSRSINLCFAGTQAAWTRDQWLTKFGNAIDVAAYLFVQDAKKYGIPTKVIAPPCTDRLPGCVDHAYITKVLKDGTHTDVGDGFPWSVFAAAVAKYAGETTAPVTPAPTAPAAKAFPTDWTDRDLLIEIVRQLRGPTLNGWTQLGNRTLVDAVASLMKDAA